MADLRGRRILVLEARRGQELARLIERHGGLPILAPALEEVPQPEHPSVAAFREALAQGAVDGVIFLSGVGARLLLAAVGLPGPGGAVEEALRRCWVVCRGPKPTSVLRGLGLPVTLITPPPHTTETLIATLAQAGWDLRGQVVAVQWPGEPIEALREALHRMGARCLEVFPYRWAMPADTGPLREGLQRILEGSVEAVCFTSRPQVLHLFQLAHRAGQGDALREALRARLCTAAVGPVTAQALMEHGVLPHVVAPVGTMGRLVHALAEWLSGRGATDPGGALPPGPGLRPPEGDAGAPARSGGW